MMDKVRKWGLRFDGGKDPKDALVFLERVEELARCYSIPMDHIPRVVPEFLKGKALAWYRNNKREWTKWEDFVSDFKSYHLPHRQIFKFEEEVRQCHQRTNQKLKDHALNLQSLMRWIPEMSADQQLERIYENMLPEYKLYIRRRDFESLTELLWLGEEFEHIAEEKAKSTSNPTARTWSTAPATEARCWNCDQPGHNRRDCHQNRYEASQQTRRQNPFRQPQNQGTVNEPPPHR